MLPLGHGPMQPGPAGPGPGPINPIAALLAAKASAAAAPPSGGEGSAIGHLQTAMAALHAYVAVEPDQEDKAVAMTCLQNLQKVLAKDQKERHAALGVTPAHKALASG